MEAVLISDVSTSWTTVKLDNTYSNAIPVCIYYTNLPTVSGIQNITSNSFQLKIQGWENGVASTNDVHCLIVSNLRPYMASNVTVTDVLPAGLSYVPSSISGGDSTDDSDLYGAGLSWTIASLASSTSTTLTYTVSVLAP